MNNSFYKIFKMLIKSVLPWESPINVISHGEYDGSLQCPKKPKYPIKPQILTGPNQELIIKKLEISKHRSSLIAQLNPRLFRPAPTANGTLLLFGSFFYLASDCLI